MIKVGETEISIQKLQKELKVLTDVTEEDDVCLLERQFDVSGRGHIVGGAVGVVITVSLVL